MSDTITTEPKFEIIEKKAQLKMPATFGILLTMPDGRQFGIWSAIPFDYDIVKLQLLTYAEGLEAILTIFTPNTDSNGAYSGQLNPLQQKPLTK